MDSKPKGITNGIIDSVVNLLTPSKSKNIETSEKQDDNATVTTAWSISNSTAPRESNASQCIPNTKAETRNKKSKRYKQQQDVPRFCLSECPRGGVHDSEMVQCHFCQVWYHYQCGNTSESELENVTVWTCQKCRQLPSVVNCLLNKFDKMSQNIERLLEDNKTMKNENNELKTMIQNQNILIDTIKLEKIGKGENPSDETLLIGSSILRDVPDTYVLDETKVISKSGGKVSTIKEELIDFKGKRKFQQTCLVVGGNDVDSPKETSSIMSDFRNFIAQSKSISDHVTVASI